MLTLKDIQEATKIMRANAITPQGIKTQEEADLITREQRELLNDPNARQWNVGDEYYTAIATPLDNA